MTWWAPKEQRSVAPFGCALREVKLDRAQRKGLRMICRKTAASAPKIATAPSLAADQSAVKSLAWRTLPSRAAAQTTLAALQALPPELQQHISIDIALHHGDAAYGNIGSGNRLDFTAIGRDINILSRLELLCKDIGRPLLMTGTFATEVAA
jgi:class 3 adenylate cyclase